jgi:hypothetical protein
MLADESFAVRAPSQTSYHYLKFMRSFLRKAAGDLKADELRDLAALLNVMLNERIAADKAKDKKPKKKGTSAPLFGFERLHSISVAALDSAILPHTFCAAAATKKKVAQDDEDDENDFVEDELDAFM